MNYLVSSIVDFMIEQDVISNDEDVQNFYRYGIEISLSSVLNIVLVLAIGLLIRHFTESVIFLLIFIFVRSFTGGYHADTYFRCNLLMCVTFALTVWVNSTVSGEITLTTIIAITCITELIVAIMSPVENKNKLIDSSRRLKLKIKVGD